MTLVVPPSAVIVKVTVVTPADVVETETVLSDKSVYATEFVYVKPVPVGTYDVIGHAAFEVVNTGKT